MKHLLTPIKISVLSIIFSLLFMAPVLAADASTCNTSDQGYPKSTTFLGLIPWYQYVQGDFNDTGTPGICGFHANLSSDGNNAIQTGPQGIGVFWLIVLAIFEDLLRVAGLLAVVFVTYGGIRFITSQGEPENTKAARGTIINALIGLAITVVAAGTVAFIAKSLGG